MRAKEHIHRIVDFANGRLSPDDALELLEEIERDNQASLELDLVVDVMNATVESCEQADALRERGTGLLWQRILRAISQHTQLRPVLYPLTGLALVCAVIMVGVLFNSPGTKSLEDLAPIDATAFTWNVRGGGESDITAAYQHFTRAEYEKSLLLLDRYLRVNPDGTLTDYVNYTAGAVCLISSREKVFYVFGRINIDQVNRGLRYLTLAVGRTSNRRLLEESLFLRAKGYLLLHRAGEATADLQSVCDLGGSRRDEALRIIQRIHAITSQVNK